MNQAAHSEHQFGAPDVSLQPAAEPLTFFPSVSSIPSVSFFDPISTA